MSVAVPICEGDKHVGYVCMAGPRLVYYAAVRRHGHKTFQSLGKSRSERGAMQRVVDAMAKDHELKRGGVWFSEPGGYYEPTLIWEAVR